MGRHLRQAFSVLTVIGAFCFQTLLIEHTNAAVGCHVGWSSKSSSKSCIMLFSESSSWSDARYVCKGVKADLVIIKSDEENTEVATVAGEDEIWIGLRLFNGSDEKWLDSADPVDYTNWQIDRPNIEGEACGALLKGEWLDETCNLAQGFICERPTECVNNTYGENCKMECSVNCGGEKAACNLTTGNCLEGCAFGYTGPHCEMETKPMATEERSKLPQIAMAIIFVLAAVSIGIFFLVQRKKNDAGDAAGNVEAKTDETANKGGAGEKKDDSSEEENKSAANSDEEEENEDEEDDDEGHAGGEDSD